MLLTRPVWSQMFGESVERRRKAVCSASVFPFDLFQQQRHLQVAFQPEFLRAVSCEEDARAPWQIVFGCAKDAEDTRARMSNCFLDL